VGEDRKYELEGALLLGDEEDEDDLEHEGGHSGPPGTPRDGKAEAAVEFLSDVLSRMGLQTEVKVREDDVQIVLDIQGPDAGRAIGKRGTTLYALQFLVNKVINRFPKGRRYIVVDSGDYRKRHDQNLINLAWREAKRAVQLGQTVTLAPMPARDRRLIHLSLAKFPGVSTQSNGEGPGRRIQIIPVRERGSGRSAPSESRKGTEGARTEGARIGSDGGRSSIDRAPRDRSCKLERRSGDAKERPRSVERRERSEDKGSAPAPRASRDERSASRDERNT